MSVLLADVGPFWLRLGLTDADGEVVRLHHEFPGRGEPRLGELYRAKVHANEPRLGGVFCDLGGAQGFLPVKGHPPRVGDTITVWIRREAIGAKACQLVAAPSLRLPGATVRWGDEGTLTVSAGPLPVPDEASNVIREQALVAGEAAFAEGPPGLAGGAPPLVRAATGLVSSDTSEVRASDADAAATLRAWLEPLGLAVGLYDAAPIQAALDEAEEDALRRTVGLPGGGAVTFDEAEALTAIDIDAGRRDARSAKGAQEAVAATMLSVIGRQAALRSLGGQIVLDLPRRAFASPKVLRDRLTKALTPLGRVSVPAVTNEGVVVVIAPRAGPSLLERLTESDGDGVLPGRRLRDDALAASACRVLARSLSEDRAARRVLACPARARPYVEDAAPALMQRYGARFEIVTQEGPPDVR